MQDLTSSELLANADWLRRLARSLVLDESQADDLVQETWMAALRAQRRPRNLRGWLTGVVHNLARNQGRGAARRKQREQATARAEAQPAAESTQALIERERALLDRVEVLPDAQRDVIIARYFEGLAPREIAARTGAPIATVKTRLTRALAHLRADLDEQYGNRREWCLWFAPLATDQRVLPAWVSMLAVAAGLVVLASGAWYLVNAPGVDWDLGQQPVPMAEAQAEVLDVPDDPAESQRTPVPGPGVDLVFKSNGVAQAQALVQIVDSNETEIPMAMWPDLQRVCEQLGRAALSDEHGALHLDGEGPWMVRASKGDLVGLFEVEVQGSPIELELTASPRMRLRVVEERGQPVAGVPVQIRVALEDGTPASAGGPSIYGLERVSSEEGMIVLHDPLGLAAKPGGMGLHLDRVRIDLPGLGSRRGEAIFGPDTDWSRATAPLDLTLAPHGKIEVRVVERGGEPIDLTGSALIRVLGEGNWGQEIALEKGVASWPRVGLDRRYQVRVMLPSLGASFETEGAGPEREGALASWSATPPARASYTARLVTSEGEPHRVGRILFNLPGDRPGMNTTVGPLTPDANGQVRVELPEGARIDRGGVFELWNAQVGWKAVDLPPVDIGQVADLGEVRIDLAPLPTLRGRCLDDAGDPVPGMRVSAATATGNMRVIDTGADGRFDMRATFDAVTVVEVQDPEARFLPLEPIEASIDAELIISLERGGTLTAQLLLPAYLRKDRTWLTVRTPTGRTTYPSLEADGSFRLGALTSEPLDLELRLNGTIAAHVVRDIDPQRGSLRIDLREQWREVKVRVTNVDRRQGASCRVFNEQGVLHLANLPGSVPVPMDGDWKLSVDAKGYLSVVLAASEVGDTLELALPRPLRVTVIPSADGEAGSFALEPAHAQARHELPALEQGVPTTLELPGPGVYRLVRISTSRAGGGLQAIGRTPTTFVLEVPQDPTGLTFDLDLKAPPQERDH